MSAKNKANDIVCAFAQYHGFPNRMWGEAGVRLRGGGELYLDRRGNLNCLVPGTRCGTFGQTRLVDEQRRFEDARPTSAKAAVLYRKHRLVAGGAL
jgi:hypothetical protein